MDITREERNFIEAHIENGKELILSGDVESLLDRMSMWTVVYGRKPNGSMTTEGWAVYDMMQAICDRHSSKKKEKQNIFRESGVIELTPEERRVIEETLENGAQLIRDNDLDEIMDDLDWKSILATKGVPVGVETKEHRRICDVILSVGNRNGVWEPSPKDSSTSVNGKKPVTEKEPARRVIFELTTKERPFVRRNLDDGSKLIIDGDVYALYMAMLKWVQSHEIRRDGDLTRTGRKIVEMAEAIRDRNGGEKQPENCALRLELTDEEREYIKENVLFGERILHEGNLDRLCARLTRMANDRMARGDQGEEYCKLLSMCDAISLRNTSRKERLDVTEEEFQFIQENIERGITWVCGRKLDKLNRNLMDWIFENCVDENRTLTPEGERIHQMRKAIFRRNNKRTDLA